MYCIFFSRIMRPKYVDHMMKAMHFNKAILFSFVSGLSYFGLRKYQMRESRRDQIEEIDTGGLFKGRGKFLLGITGFVSYFTFDSCLFTILGFKLVKYADCVLSEEMVLSGRIEDINKLKIQPKDIFVASFPKSGTTWLQQVVYLLLADTENSNEGN